LLGWLLLVGPAAPTAVNYTLTLMLTALYAASDAVQIKSPDDVLIGYQG